MKEDSINPIPATSYAYFFSSPGDSAPIPPSDIVVTAFATVEGEVRVRNTALTFGPLMNALEGMMASTMIAMHITLIQKCRECPEALEELALSEDIFSDNSVEAISESARLLLTQVLHRAHKMLEQSKDPTSESSHSIQQIQDLDAFRNHSNDNPNP